MNRDNYRELEVYYHDNICGLIFEYENQLTNEHRHKFFTYNYDNEMSNFVKTFTEYLPYYVANYDQSKYYEANSKNLLGHSKRLWVNLDQKQNFESNGIFGELFLDFYRRIYNHDDIIAGYAIRKEFSSKEELKGIDNFSFCVIKSRPTIIFSEAKFVKDIYAAKKGLIEDINAHLEFGFINKFSGFMMRQGSLSSVEHTEDARLHLDRLNEILIKKNLDFIPAINKLNYKVKFVYFAICQSDNKEQSLKEKYFDQIRSEFNSKVKASSGINSYDVEIILIPTRAIPKDIKQEIVGFYE